MKLAALAFAILLAGCHEQREAMQSDDRICTSPISSMIPGDYRACVHRWAYRLAKSPDPAAIVAQAAVAACEDAFAFDASRDSKNPQHVEAIMAQRMGWLQNNSLFWVVQARAGKCIVP